ncbi:MAG TPA: hypothetical protein VGI48_12230 [Caldimonas sp.]|jgi:hypothetical protein
MLIALSVLLGILGLAAAVSAFLALLRARLFRFVFRALAALMLLAAGSVLGFVSLGIQGMRALTNEEIAARIHVAPTAPQRYEATLTFPDGRVERYDLAGDDIYIDGHIVKWTSLGNMLGLQTSYRLDRISGRYRALEQENTMPRTIYAIGTPSFIDLVALGSRLPLADFFDAEYGSATYIPVSGPADLELKVSTSGLLLRNVAQPIVVPKS